MAKTPEEISKLKVYWYNDPIWDLYDTEGFEEYKEELKAYQEECEARWKGIRLQSEMEIDIKAKTLGMEGLYRLILEQNKTIKELKEKIEFLSDKMSR